MKAFDDLKVIAISMLLVVGLGACDAPGPAETAGKQFDQAFDEAGQKLSDAVDQFGEAMSETSSMARGAISDTEITAKVKAAILVEPRLATLLISVDTVNSVVTLSGSVDSMMHSDMADALAKGVHGVSQVNNYLQIRQG